MVEWGDGKGELCLVGFLMMVVVGVWEMGGGAVGVWLRKGCVDEVGLGSQEELTVASLQWRMRAERVLGGRGLWELGKWHGS